MPRCASGDNQARSDVMLGMDRTFRIALQAESASQNAAPAFLAVVVGKGSIAYTRDDGVAAIPMAALGA